ncbi:MAG: hypothetical protein A3I75_06725 [Deltaproteobacteria bacterium RIFCSPLOWO2_02_FULL_50_16]|nr:MAG: hypothetical protein A2053_01000 [Deltaproteobacteria bacterium GWA2_50_8]OGQ25785.1 MAG: hypothetical protein A3B79_04615 [Deltaproteobacteria bacterium RIFCSPHIGHO2_02_FULL_50_15]OGQ57251.1 MAG: hypothetical protein A3I75_06725 [Deltaproteobacteria bacterium RIFCSPLOWO2_02_FULL_50_16]OGQ65533.1 MAG: hypothetical protein A3F89_06760 [Deltaproteobacteria bacterium RIFCSPLOWO2_12_FULL_50_11]
MRFFFSLLVLLLGFFSGVRIVPAQVPLLLDKKIVDLTHPLATGMPYFPGNIPFSIHPLIKAEEGYQMSVFSASEHHGTHLDAPSHFFSKKTTVDKIPLDFLLRPVVKIDVSQKVEKNSDYRLSVDDIRSWEKENGPIPKGSYVMLYTGWDERWPQPAAYINQDDKGEMHFPGFSCEAAQYLVDGCHVQGVGIDTLSGDAGLEKDFCVHRIILKWEKFIIENVANLSQLPPRGSYILVAPLRLAEGSGAPARVWAWLP